MDDKRDHVLPAGEITVWKVGQKLDSNETVYIELLVPAAAQRVTQHGCDHWECLLMRKSRVEFAQVIGIADKNGEKLDEARAMYRRDFTYKVGETVRPDMFDPNPDECCGHGIHVHRFRDDCSSHDRIQQIRDQIRNEKANKTAASDYEKIVLDIMNQQILKLQTQPLDYSVSKKKKNR